MLGDLGWPKTRVNLRIRAHITTYYHLQIVITNDHRLGMALAMDNRTHSLACTVCMIHTLLEPWLLWPGMQWSLRQELQKRVHHFLVIIFSDPRSRRCPRCCQFRTTREAG